MRQDGHRGAEQLNVCESETRCGWGEKLTWLLEGERKGSGTSSPFFFFGGVFGEFSFLSTFQRFYRHFSSIIAKLC